MNYQQAKKAAMKNKGTSYEYDAGQGNRGITYFCNTRQRLIQRVTRDAKIWF